MLTCLRVSLCLTFAVTVGIRGFKVTLFLSLLLPLAPLVDRVCTLQLFSSNPLLLYCSPIDVVVRFPRGEALYNRIIKSVFNRPISLGCDLHRCFLAFFPSHQVLINSFPMEIKALLWWTLQASLMMVTFPPAAATAMRGVFLGSHHKNLGDFLTVDPCKCGASLKLKTPGGLTLVLVHIHRPVHQNYHLNQACPCGPGRL